MKCGKHGLRGGPPGEYAGYGVYDPVGTKIGEAKEVLANDAREPEYIRVKTGLLRPRLLLIPVQTVTVDEGRKGLVLG